MDRLWKGQIFRHSRDAISAITASPLCILDTTEGLYQSFKKGHILREEDIAELLKMGKEHLYVLELNENQIHEDDAVLRIAKAICGEGIRWSDPVEGKTNIISTQNGVLKIDISGLLRINKLGDIIVSTLKTNFPCAEGQTVAATRTIPLTISRKKIEKLEELSKRFHPVIQILPYKKLTVGAVVTGSEICKGLIKDEFDPYVGDKVRGYGCEFVKKLNVPDDAQAIAGAVQELRELGCGLILTTGGLSVDPDDVTKRGVEKAGARTIFYGSPVLPGAMFLYADFDGTKILGLPACVYYHSVTVFDLILPRVLVGEEITPDTIAEMGHGGLCLNCTRCRYPECSFGK